MRRFALLVTVVMAVLAVAAPAVAGPANEKAKTNGTAYWEAMYPGLTCEKVEDGFDDSGMWTAPADYDLVVVKGGPAHEVYMDVAAGDVLYAPDNPNSGKLYGVSHVIMCNGDPSGPSDPGDPGDPSQQL